MKSMAYYIVDELVPHEIMHYTLPPPFSVPNRRKKGGKNCQNSCFSISRAVKEIQNSFMLDLRRIGNGVEKKTEGWQKLS